MPDGSVIINEAKQMSVSGSMTLGTSQAGTQMSGYWIDEVIGKMKNSPNPQAQELYLTLLAAKNQGKISKIVSAVDKSSSEIVITRLKNSF